MPDKKLTDKEIVKALECCTNDGVADCDNCPYEHNCNTGGIRMLNDALSFINRLQAENERLKSDVSVSRDAYMSMKDRYEYEKEKVEKAKQKCIDIGKALKNAKTEAYKEFAEKMKGVIQNIDDTYIERIVEDYIDNLLKELVGDE